MNTLQTNTVSIAAALKLAKPYVGSLRRKDPGGRPILKCALVTEEYVIATNTHYLIRIRHNESVTEPYLHHFKEEYKEYMGSLTAKNYPPTERLFPTKEHAMASGPVEVKEMIEAADGAQVVAAKNEKILQEIFKDKVIQERVWISDSKFHVGNPNQPETSEYTHQLNRLIPIKEEMLFDGKYLSQVFRTFRQHKEKEVDMFYYGPVRPLYLVAGVVEVIVLPCRKN